MEGKENLDPKSVEGEEIRSDEEITEIIDGNVMHFANAEMRKEFMEDRFNRDNRN